MAASENIDTIIETLQSPQLEGFKSEIYIPEGCFVDKGNKRVVMNDLKKEYKNPSDKSDKRPEWPGSETACISDPLRTWKTIGKSGFTIATGFDISQYYPFEIKKFNFSKEVENKLLPFSRSYSGPAPDKKASFSTNELKEIDRKVVSKKISVLAEKYDTQSKTKKFDDLNVHYQTVLYSIYHQYEGNFFNLSYSVNKVWQKAIADDWNGVYDELIKMNDGFSGRRKKEAELIDYVKTNEKQKSPVGDYPVTGNIG